MRLRRRVAPRNALGGGRLSLKPLKKNRKIDLVFYHCVTGAHLKPLTPGEVARLCRDGEGNKLVRTVGSALSLQIG